MNVLFTGDWRFFYPENIIDFASLPSGWDASLNTGIGKSALSSLWINSYLNFTATFTKFGLSWDAIGLIFWILPSIILSFFSAYYLFKTLFPDSKRFGFLAGFVYFTNTYFLMIFTGGQMGVALSYALTPLVLLGFIRVIRDSKLKNSIIAGLLLGLQVLFDPRIAYITMIAVAVLNIKKLTILAIPIIIAILLHSYWALPLVITKSPPLPEGFSSVKGFEFFSFADFSHALSLLHPNWPENIFGKVYFLQPEFLILPILAYSSLLFINKKTHGTILFFALLGLIGTFLAKGANPPFGEINSFLFQYFPGMNMFRDPTKFYLLIVLSYSILIPYSLFNISSWINSKFNPSTSLRAKIQKYLPNILLLLVTCYLLLLIRPLWAGELREKFKPREIPKEYVQLKDLLHNQPQFFRTLWIPQWQRFGYFSNLHPAIGRYEILKSASASGQIEELTRDSSKELLKDLVIKYVIVPYDSEREIFLEDRKYSESLYSDTIKGLENIDWLKRVGEVGKIAVFEIDNPKDHFWSPSTGLRMNYNFLNPTEYKVEVKNAQKGDLLVFSEGFDKNWMAALRQSSGQEEFRIQSSKFKDTLNSFILPKNGDYALKVHYEPQKWVNVGLVITGITILAVLGLWGITSRKNK